MENTERNDIYAGDEAWREWFDACAVSRCGAANAARLGVVLHGMAGDLWKGAQRAMSADDLAEMISEAWKEISVLS